MRKTIFATAILTLGLAACGSPTPESGAQDSTAATATTPAAATPDATKEASAGLMTADGKDVGTVTAMQVPDGVRIAIDVEGLSPGAHGAHIHDVGTCKPDFKAAGPHWAPFDVAMHLANDSADDDSPNAAVNVGQDGTGKLEYTLPNIKLQDMLAGNGSSFMIHQRKDDPAMKAAPGNGDRIACGVFATGAAPAAPA